MMTNESPESLFNVVIVLSVGLQTSEDSKEPSGDRPGSHLFSVKQAEKMRHHLSYNSLSICRDATIV